MIKLDELNEVNMSGWTGDFYFNSEQMPNQVPIIFRGDEQYDEIKALIEDSGYVKYYGG